MQESGQQQEQLKEEEREQEHAPKPPITEKEQANSKQVVKSGATASNIHSARPSPPAQPVGSDKNTEVRNSFVLYSAWTLRDGV